MANKKISGLTNSLTKSTVATNDLTVVVDTSASESKKMTYGELMSPIDSVFRVAGSSDNTKLVAFEVDGLTTATTRTITVPDADLTLVGVATTQTLTNKTLTSPQINFSSNGVGDLIYRNGSGITDRLAIGSTDQILAVQGGVPTWIANPSATTATTSAAGIVELATTAETTTGTDATRAVTPDGLHDMTSLAGAAWFLDEDTMSSNSDTKTASQQSIKAYVDNLRSFTSGTTTKNSADASTTQNIAHGLGKTPKNIKITAIPTISDTTERNRIAITTYNGTTQSSLSNFGTSSNCRTVTTFSLNSGAVATDGDQTGVVTFDSTNIIITWTKTSLPTGTYTLLWQAEA